MNRDAAIRLLLLMPLLWTDSSWSAPCAYTNYSFTSQAEVDALARTGCTSVSGHLEISSLYDITNIDGLSNLTSIGGYLFIYNNDALTNLDGLAKLSSVGGYLSIRSNATLGNCSGIAPVLGWPEGPPQDSVEGYIELYNNSEGCNTVAAILNAYTGPAVELVPPDPPTYVRVADGTDPTRLRVTWSAVPQATSYNIYQSSTNSNGNYSLLGNVTGTSVDVTGLSAGVTYYIAVSAVNTAGESAKIFDTGYLSSPTPTSHTITISSGLNGSVDPSTPQSVDEGGQLSITITPGDGYAIGEVFGTCGGTLNGSIFTTAIVIADCSVNVSFTEIPTFNVSFNVSSEGGGEVSPAAPQTVQEGETVTFSLSPDAGYETSANHILGSCEGVFDSSTSTYVTKPITASCEMNVNFYESPETKFSNLLATVNQFIDATATDSGIPNSYSRLPNTSNMEAEQTEGESIAKIPTLSNFGLFILSALMTLLGLRRLKVAG